MKTKVLFFAGLLIVLPVVSEAQIGNLLKKGASKVVQSVGKAASKEANKEIDSLAQKQADKVVENAADNARENREVKEGENPRPGGGIGARLFSNEVTVKYNQEYSFSSRMYMLMEIFNENKEPVKMDYNIYYSQNSPNAGIEMKTIAEADGESMPMTTQIIVDGENKSFLMVTELTGMKIGLVSPVPDDSTLAAMDKNSGTKPPKVTKTGNSKVIAGFKCDEYLYQEEGEKDYMKMWMTKDAVMKIDKSAWSKAGMPSAYGYPGFEGLVNMAWESYDEDNRLAARSEVKEINNNHPHAMSVAGTSFRQVDFARMAAGQNKKK